MGPDFLQKNADPKEDLKVKPARQYKLRADADPLRESGRDKLGGDRRAGGAHLQGHHGTSRLGRLLGRH
jgi:hypothetical protein